MGAVSDALERGRDAFERRAWSEAFQQLTAADLSDPLDLERLAVTANLLGTVARLYLIRVLGKAFESPIERVLDFFAEYRIPLLIASIVLVGGSFLLDKRKGGSDLDVVEELEHEAERDA